VKEIWLVSGWAMGWQVKTIVLYTGGCLLSLSMCRRGFQDLLKGQAISLSHTRPRPPCGSLPFHYRLCKRTHPYPVALLPIGLGYFRAKPPVWTPQLFSNLVIIRLLAYEDGTECSETSAYKIQTPGKLPRRKHITMTSMLNCKVNVTKL